MQGKLVKYKQFNIIREGTEFRGRGNISCTIVETPKFKTLLDLTQHVDKFYKDYEQFAKRAPLRVKEYLKCYNAEHGGHNTWLNMSIDKKMKRVFGKRSGPYATTKK
jgi:hypothetical protein